MLLPDDKEEFVRQLQLQREEVAMVGDGINDSQALPVVLDVSIAMGKGTDIAWMRQMVTLMTSDLLLFAESYSISLPQTVRLIHQNLFWAFHLQPDRYSYCCRIALSNQWIIAEPHAWQVPLWHFPVYR